MVEINKKQISGTRKEILDKLKESANPNCKKCLGRGYIGYKENKKGIRIYIACQKCVNKKL
jgi:hypothetical protein